MLWGTTALAVNSLCLQGKITHKQLSQQHNQCDEGSRQGVLGREEKLRGEATEVGCGQVGTGLHAMSRNLKSILETLNSQENFGW